MADVRITQLPVLTTMTDEAVVPAVSGNVTQQITGENLKNYFTANITGNIGFVGDAMYDLNGVIVENADLSHGATAAVILPSNGNATAPVQINNTYGNVVLQSGSNAAITSTWAFNADGNLILPSNTSSINYANGQPYGGSGSGNSISNYDSNVSIPSPNGNVYVNTDGPQWAFDTTGVLTFPNNSPDWPIRTQRFGMGNLLAWNDGGWTIGEYNGTSLGTEGIRINPGIEGQADISLPSDAAANTQPLAISNYNSNGNVTILSNASTWKFDKDGAINLPNPGTVRGPYVNAVSNNFVQLQWVDTGNLNIANPNNTSGPTNWLYVDQGGIHLETNINTGNGVAQSVSLDNTGNLTASGNVIAPNFIASANFVGTSIKPNLTNFNWSEAITNITLGTTTTITLAKNVFGDPWTGQVTITEVGGAIQANATWWYEAVNSNAFVLYTDSSLTTLVDSSAWDAYTSGGFAVTLGYANVVISGQNVTIRNDHGDYNNRIWQFNVNGQTVFPYQDIVRGDIQNGNITGYAMVMGDGTGEAIISTPNAGTGQYNSQRLVINPGKGEDGTAGEGGDIYLWAGRGGSTNGNGGDVKIRGGYGPGDGQGGYIRVEAGDVQGTGTPGYIYQRGGDVGIGTGGYIQQQGGQGTTGGYISLTGGYGTDGPGGAVTIAGGQAAGGLPYYGNVGISAGASSWAFDNTGTLTFPSLANISSGNFNAGTASATVGLNAFSPDGNTVAIRAQGNNSSAVIETYVFDGPTHQWTFDISGNLTVPGNIIGTQANVELVANSNLWNFDTNGTLTTPGNTLQIGLIAGNTGLRSINSANVSIDSDGNVWVFNTNGILTAPGDITTTGNVSAQKGTFTGNITGSQNFDIDGNATIGGNLFVTGNINFTGNVTQISGNSGVFYGNASTGVGALYAGKTGYTPLPNTVVQITGDDNAYVQVNLQNTNHGNTTSMELAITADDGDDVNNYIDMGIAGSTWDGTQTNSLGTAVARRDGYLYVQGGAAGGNLILGTTTAGYAIKFNAGGPNSANTVASISNIGIETSGIVSATGNIRGSNINTAGLVTATGNVTGGNINTAGIVSATGNITGGNIIATNIGNVAALNLNGNASTILYGNGVFGAISAGTSLVNGTSNVVVSTTNVTISTNGNASVMDIGLDSRVRLGGLKVIGGNINAGDGSLQFATSGLTINGGNLQLASGGYIKGPAGYNVLLLNSPENTSLRIQGNLAVGASNTGNIYGGNVSVSGNVTVSGSGGVSQPNLPAFRVYGNSSSTIASGTTITATQGATVDYNQGSYYNNTTGIFTAPVAGIYQTAGTLRVGTNNGLNQAAVLKNGTTIGTGLQIAFWEISGNSATAHMGFSGFAKLAVNDTLRLQVIAGNVEFDSNDSWGVTFLG